MRVTAKDALAIRKRAVSFASQLLSVMTGTSISPRFQRTDMNYSATGAEAVILDTEQHMEYVVTVTPRRRPDSASLQ